MPKTVDFVVDSSGSQAYDDVGVKVDVAIAAADSDSDGLDDAEEAGYGTNPNDSDSDDDGLSDGDEVDLWATDPLSADSDYDGLTDGEEVDTTDTDPLYWDSDGDYLSDDGEWCAQRADWYQDAYLADVDATSGGWKKWSRADGGSWSAPDTNGYNNYFGCGVAGTGIGNWCSEWYLGGRELGILPGDIGAEAYSPHFIGGELFTLRVGATRLETCGF